jgi:hypothetical protein
MGCNSLEGLGKNFRDGKMMNEGQLLESISKTTKEWSGEGKK